MEKRALGLIETYGLTPAIEAADAAVKAAMVSLRGYVKVKSGIITVAVEGDVAAVKAAVQAGAAAAEKVGRVLSTHVIPRPIADIDVMIQTENSAGPEVEKSGPNIKFDQTEDHIPEIDNPNSLDKFQKILNISYGELEKMTVHELRRFARKLTGLSIQGREISKANKEKLLREITMFVERSEKG